MQLATEGAGSSLGHFFANPDAYPLSNDSAVKGVSDSGKPWALYIVVGCILAAVLVCSVAMTLLLKSKRAARRMSAMTLQLCSVGNSNHNTSNMANEAPMGQSPGHKLMTSPQGH